ncbi:MAG: hypothetical protein EZS28_046970 [Streblomastix strix]|uniref:Uncharacterized protein n=1 Tax=Streblomastix strix TaxID=222440 RepID=A0A5J4TGF2_9EUKA|nr:MAG: hypothetical protein EZS28_046970 [Streblomastix strix]
MSGQLKDALIREIDPIAKTSMLFCQSNKAQHASFLVLKSASFNSYLRCILQLLSPSASLIRSVEDSDN